MKDLISIKKIFFLVTIVILLLSSIFFCIYISHKGDEKNSVSKNILLNKKHKYIKIIKTGNSIVEKKVTSGGDMEKIITFLKSIKFQKKLNTQIKGWIYSITIVNTDGSTFNVELLGNNISYGNSFYIIDRNVVEEFNNLYSKLNYSEMKPKVSVYPNISFSHTNSFK